MIKTKRVPVWSTPEFKARASAIARAAMARPDVKAEHLAAVRAAMARPEVLAKISALSRRNWADPAYRAKHSAGARAAAITQREKSRAAYAAWCLAHPEPNTP